MKTSDILIIAGIGAAALYFSKNAGAEPFAPSVYGQYTTPESMQQEIARQRDEFAGIVQVGSKVKLSKTSTGETIGEFTQQQISDLLANKSVSIGSKTFKIEDFSATKQQVINQMDSLGWSGSSVYEKFKQSQFVEQPRAELITTTNIGGKSKASSSNNDVVAKGSSLGWDMSKYSKQLNKK